MEWQPRRANLKSGRLRNGGAFEMGVPNSLWQSWPALGTSPIAAGIFPVPEPLGAVTRALGRNYAQRGL